MHFSTLRPAKDESVNWDSTQNIFIEGDNLEVLKLLQKSYHRSVKMIYIDPPYNTGNDFVYEDDFADNIKNYHETTGQTDEDGKKISTNSESNGRYHTNWLNMMYPRLKLARNLLRDDGVIFISIDDNEQANLKMICDDIFGEGNFVANLIVKSAPAGTQSSNDFAIQQSYCLAYRKSSAFKANTIKPSNEELKKKYSYGKDDKGKYYIERLWKRGKGGKKEDVPSLHFPVYYDETNNKIYIDEEAQNIDNLIKIIPYQSEGVLGRWTWSKKSMLEKRDYLEVAKVSGNYKLHKKVYIFEDLGRKPYSIIDSKIARTELGSVEVKDIFTNKIFDYPKPKTFMMYCINIATSQNDLILDFFAGSGTTAHAVIQLNAEDGGSRRCISVQLPELTDEKTEAYKAGYKNIAEICKERIRRAGKKIKQENPDYEGDLGFRAFKLDTANLKRWEADFDTLEQDLINALDNIKPDRSSDDLLYDIMLKFGLDLALPIETKEIAGKKIYSMGNGAMIACLDNDISFEVVEAIGKLKQELQPEQFVALVFIDGGFRDDATKINAIQNLRHYGIEESKIKSL